MPHIKNKIRFEKATLAHQDIIFEWLAEPHIKEFWDNSQEHKDDILNFINGQKQHYFYGTTRYWIGYYDNQPFCFVLSDELLANQEDLTDLHRTHLSKVGKTISLDFGIGNKDLLGKGLAAPTLMAFTKFYQGEIDPKADTFFIDPDENNPRAQHVYEKAGFKIIGKAIPQKGYFIGSKSFIMVKKLETLASIRPATQADLGSIVVLSDKKRTDYERVQPQFWRRAEKANEEQTKWFEFLMARGIGIFLVAEVENRVVGFIRGQLENAPEVYNPGGATLMIDDFCVESPDLWPTVGQQLLQELMVQAKQRGASQVVIVAGHHDEPKRQFLKSQGLGIASEWYVSRIE